MDLIPFTIPAALVAYITVGRHIAFMVYVAAGATVFIREGREWTVKEAADRGRPLVWQTALSFICLRLSEVDWAGLWTGFVLFCTQARLHAEVWWAGRVRDYNRTREWLIALFRDKEAERIAIAKAQYDDATLRRNALYEVNEFDFEPTPWATQATDLEHDRARREYDALARKPELSDGEATMLASVILQLRRYGDNPLTIRRESAPAPAQGFASLAVAATGASLVKTGLAWIAPRVTVLLIIVCAVSVWQWRRADARADTLELAVAEAKAQLQVGATALDAANTRIQATAKGCLDQIAEAAQKAKDKAAADTAAKLRRVERAKSKAAAGDVPRVNGDQWVRDLFGAPADGEPAAAAPNPGAGGVPAESEPASEPASPGVISAGAE